MMNETIQLILQHSGVAGVVLIFWYLDSRRRDKQFEMMWKDHQELATRSVQALENNTRAVENLKGYIKTAIKPAPTESVE